LVELITATYNGKKAETLAAVLTGLLDAGIGISNSGAEVLKSSMGDEMTRQVSELIEKLTSGELTMKPDILPTVEESTSGQRSRSQAQSQILNYEEKSTAELESLLENAISNQRPTKGLKKQLLFHYCREKELEKAEKIKQVQFAFLNLGFAFNKPKQ